MRRLIAVSSRKSTESASSDTEPMARATLGLDHGVREVERGDDEHGAPQGRRVDELGGVTRPSHRATSSCQRVRRRGGTAAPRAIPLRA